MATAPLLLLIVAAAPRPGDAVVSVRGLESIPVVASFQDVVTAPKTAAPQKATALPRHDVAARPATPARRPASPPVLEIATPPRVGAVAAPALPPRFEPAQPRGPPRG